MCDVNVCQSCHVGFSERPWRSLPPKNVIVNAETSLDVSSLSMDDGVAATNATTSVPITDIVIHPPKPIKQRMTACA